MSHISTPVSVKTVRAGRRPGSRARAAGVVTTVHGRGAASLDAMLELTARAAREAPLDEVLASLAERIAALLAVDVCSVYLVDGGGDLVLRATHGLPEAAVGVVRMRVGEGLTGLAVECMRPVSVGRAPTDERNKPFDGLGEERFPALCALPLVDRQRPVGALVVQRREARAFAAREVVLVAAMAPPVLFALERARGRRRDVEAAAAADDGRQAATETAGGGPAVRRRPSDVTLSGAGVGGARRLGTVCVRRAHVAAAAERDPSAAVEPSDPLTERRRLEGALAGVAAEMASLVTWARARLAGGPDGEGGGGGVPGAPSLRAELAMAACLAEDGRLRQRCVEEVLRGARAEAAVDRVVREYARVLGDAGDEALRARALEVEAVGARLLAHLAGDTVEPAPGRVEVGGRLSVVDALELARHHAVAVVLAAPASACPGAALAAALGLAVVCEAGSVFRWVSDGDRALVDAAAGTVVVNPSRVDVAGHRKSRAAAPR